ncbi:sigma-70 family RNA polymerase sigma factor [Methylobacterium sp. J-026]|uniref:sigma-70 family RNA polymerase sigma factor n=1 Tax=Methylobacterium sp. J-026 TaxID=2836624 RepID=UPI001FBA3CE4|nr:sigma-70 family RNA polymerase sigma factor [Methylobacterium sp. J-026]MCJ2134989.1 sigma-70 family RNA polymerase sigma factor [Methylobacterium sp. J-026]
MIAIVSPSPSASGEAIYSCEPRNVDMSGSIPCMDDRIIVDRLFRDHNSWLIKWIRSFAKSDSHAEDIAAEVFIRLLSMDRLAALREPQAMMITIAKRLMIEIFRRNQLRKDYEAELARAPVGTVASPEHQLIVLEALREISRILASMSPRARAAFLLSHIDGMTYTDVARELGVSVTMVRRYIAQGLMRFYQHHPDRG